MTNSIDLTSPTWPSRVRDRLYVIHRLTGEVLAACGPVDTKYRHDPGRRALERHDRLQAEAQARAVAEGLAPTAYVPLVIAVITAAHVYPVGQRLTRAPWREFVSPLPKDYTPAPEVLN